ncbi:hypothetical protein GF342_04615 [Candidatus Woesearchaeota archaeon]|nr:hypothetical protein [Candidatus Woesearchaeota archaeon]
MRNLLFAIAAVFLLLSACSFFSDEPVTEDSPTLEAKDDIIDRLDLPEKPKPDPLVQKQIALLRRLGVLPKGLSEDEAIIDLDRLKKTLENCKQLTAAADPQATDTVAVCRDSEFDLIGKLMILSRDANIPLQSQVDCIATQRTLSACAALSEHGVTACGNRAEQLYDRYQHFCAGALTPQVFEPPPREDEDLYYNE